MCEARILKAAKSTLGVASAEWDVDSKLLVVNFDSATTTLAKVEKQIAAAGHDTKNIQATDAKYTDLPACCKYDRLQYKTDMKK